MGFLQKNLSKREDPLTGALLWRQEAEITRDCLIWAAENTDKQYLNARSLVEEISDFNHSWVYCFMLIMEWLRRGNDQ